MTDHLAISAISLDQRLSLASSEEAGDEPGEQTANAGEADDERVRAPLPDEVLELMSDPYSRAIIATAAEQPASVADIVKQCDMSTATAYRKVNQLVETGLLDEQVRIRPEGTNLSEFVLNVETIHVELAAGGVPEVTFSVKTRADDSTVRPLSTDGGHPEERPTECDGAPTGGDGTPTETTGTATETAGRDSERTPGTRQQQLQELFLDVTGTDRLVEEQDATIQSRYLDGGDDGRVSGYVTNLARDDGLSDALPASEKPE